jgi:hypothetical protein
MTLLRELIDIPDSIPASRFVVSLTQGVLDPDVTLGEYVVTPQLAECFDKALSLIQNSLANRASSGTYLHGSFGSGKSHFMAVLSLILQGEPKARGIPELASVITKHNAWMGGKKFLLVPYHMIGATSLESWVLEGYAEYVAKLHAEAPRPPIFKSAAIIEQARAERARYGDEQFFKNLNAVKEGRSGGWGGLVATWNADSFERAATATNAADHENLVTDLVNLYKASAHVLSECVPIDNGLSIISRHAKSLGYDGLILFLDELFLWLAAHAADHKFLQVETAKLAKLVESQNADRPAPIVSFIARQRDLRELVGKNVPGAEKVNYGEFVQWNQDRFGMITLEDRNLPVITEKRILKAKSAAKKAELDAAFAQVALAPSVRKSVMDTLLTGSGDQEMFRRVFPFSPALIQTLVAVSSVLQRERTAIKVLMQLLIEQRDTLQATDLVPVGDLFDVLIHGDAVTATDVVTHFENAHKLYHQKLLPMLVRQYGKSPEEILALPAGDPTRKQFKADDRLLKTLLLAALVPEVESLKGMNAERLANLNHGTITTPLAGREVQTVATKVRGWAAEVGEIRVTGEATNPTIGIQLSDVDTDSILQKAASEDSYGNRLRIIREMVVQQALGIDDNSLLDHVHAFEWRGIKRQAAVAFRNVREMSLEQLTNADDIWKVVIDFPFDRDTHGPREDLARLDEYRTTKGSTNTIAWIPAFFSQRTMSDLGRLAVLEHVLGGDRFEQYASHLPSTARATAKAVLENQRDTLRGQVESAVNVAYGLDTSAGSAVIDRSHDLDPGDRFQSLAAGLPLRPPAATNLKASLEDLLGQALEWEFPAAPRFGTTITVPKLNSVLRKAVEATQARDGRAPVERDDRRLMADIANPLKLGDMPHDGTHFLIGHDWKERFTARKAQEAGDLTVEKLRRWINEPTKTGLTKEAENLVILVWAAQAGMSFDLHGAVCEGTIPRVDDLWTLRQEQAPDEAQWRLAVSRAGAIFGLTPSPLPTAANAAKLGADVKARAALALPAVRTYAQRLGSRLTSLGVAPDSVDRMITAQATLGLLERIAAGDAKAVVATLATASVATSELAMSECQKNASEWSGELDGYLWNVVDQVTQAGGDVPTRAEPVLTDLKAILSHDHQVLTEPFKTVLGRIHQRLLAVLAPPVPPPPPPLPPVDPPVVKKDPPPRTEKPAPVPPRGTSAGLTPDEATDEVAKIRQAHPDAKITVTVTWSKGEVS